MPLIVSFEVGFMTKELSSHNGHGSGHSDLQVVDLHQLAVVLVPTGRVSAASLGAGASLLQTIVGVRWNKISLL